MNEKTKWSRPGWVGAIGLCTLGLASITTQVHADDVDAKGRRAAQVLDALAKKLNPQPSVGLPEPVDDEDYYDRNELKEELGKFLFHDKILSGNKNISCATCHHPLTDTGDGLSLPIGEGAAGLGVTRNTGTEGDAVHERVPRNAPHVFNLGAKEFTRMFHDGRVEVDPDQPSGFRSPAGDDLPMGLDNVLAAQAMFPVTSGAEMAGQPGENIIANKAADGDLAGPTGVWAQIAFRIMTTPGYPDRFIEAFDDVDSAADITYVHVANAIAAYEAAAFRADQSPFDRFLRGENDAMSESAQRGMNLFYGSANCVRCHAGVFQTNQQFTAVAMPQIGPGKGDNLPGYKDGLDDFGRERVTGDPADRFRFRAPSLRNVALTGPWGHDGAYNTLDAVVRHMLAPIDGLNNYDTNQAVLPSRPDLDVIDYACHNDPARRQALADANEAENIDISEEQLAELIDFLHALTDPRMLDLRDAFPMSVPSGLPVFD